MVTGISLTQSFYVKTATILFHLKPIHSLYRSMNSKEKLVANLEVAG
jgi:hypothetical protein